MTRWKIECPACGEPMEVDEKSGKVVSHGRTMKTLDLGNAVQSLKEQEKNRLDMFQRSKEAEKTKSERLDKLFSKEEKRVREEKDGGRFVRDIDLD